MKNFIHPGETLTVTAPSAVASGDGVLVGTLFGIACNAAASGDPVEIKNEGVFDITALSTDVIAQGAKAYWDNTNKRITGTAGSNVLVGALEVAKASGATTARVYLDGAVR